MTHCPTRSTAIQSFQTNSEMRSTVETTAESESVAQGVATDQDAASEIGRVHSKPRWTLLWHARWTVPLHIVLPIGLSWLIRNDPSTAASAFWGVHAGFPLVLLVTAPWWWSRKDELLALLLFNHIVSFVVLAFVPWW
jgi:hypothetical protein